MKADSSIESLDYETFESVVNQSGLQWLTSEGQERRWLSIVRWLVAVSIGCCTALAAAFILLASSSLNSYKTLLLGKAAAYGDLIGFLAWVGVSGVAIAVAAVLVAVVEPVAAGSGISEIKTYLNGVKLPRVVRLRTLLAKVVGLVFGVVGGLPIGKEGPMVHAGAIMGAGLSQGKSTTLGYDTRNDRAKRDFVACGAAAGVSAAFGAPLGGVMFVLEEGVSFWHQHLTWRTFFCAMSSTFSLNLLLTFVSDKQQPGVLGTQSGTFSFGQIYGGSYGVWEVPIFILMGIGGGLLGSLFNSLNTKLTRWRWRWLKDEKKLRLAEAVLGGVLLAAMLFAVAFAFGQCHPRPPGPATAGDSGIKGNGSFAFQSSRTSAETPLLSPYQDTDRALQRANVSLHTLSSPGSAKVGSTGTYAEDWMSFAEYRYREEMVGLFCAEPSKEYNDVATLLLVPGEVAIKQLLHAPAQTFPLFSLSLFMVVFFCAACWTYGLTVPSGLFVPSLLVGAGYGRLWTHLVNAAFAVFGQGHSVTGGAHLPVVWSNSSSPSVASFLLSNTSGFSSSFPPASTWSLSSAILSLLPSLSSSSLSSSLTVDESLYGLIGAASVLGGVTRMTLSLTVILIECTGTLQYGLPLMLTLFAARWSGQIFNEGLYDIHIALRRLPFLPPDPPSLGTLLRARHVMQSKVQSVGLSVQAGSVFDLLQSEEHNAFPVLMHVRQAEQRESRTGKTALIDSSAPASRASDISYPSSLESASATMSSADPVPPVVPISSRSFPSLSASSKFVLGGLIQRKQLVSILLHKDFTSEPVEPFSRKPLSPEKELDLTQREGKGGVKKRSNASRRFARGRWTRKKRGVDASFSEDDDDNGGVVSSFLRVLLCPCRALISLVCYLGRCLCCCSRFSQAAGRAETSDIDVIGRNPLLPVRESSGKRRIVAKTTKGERRRNSGPYGGDNRADLFRQGAEPGARSTTESSNADGLSLGQSQEESKEREGSHLRKDRQGARDRRRWCLSYQQMEGMYPRYPEVSKMRGDRGVTIEEEEREMWVDLSPYINETPHVIQEDAAFNRAYRLFRGSGLRHLIVINRFNEVKGIITRKDLMEENVERCFNLAMDAKEKLFPSSPGQGLTLTRKLSKASMTRRRQQLDEDKRQKFMERRQRMQKTRQVYSRRKKERRASLSRSSSEMSKEEDDGEVSPEGFSDAMEELENLSLEKPLLSPHDDSSMV